jgi:signal transduction histidine kinase
MLAELIQERRAEILGTCEEKLRANMPERPRDELMHLIPAFLEELRLALLADKGKSDGSPLPGRSESAAKHGELRFARQYAPWDIAHDYGIVCDSLTEVAARFGRDLDVREVQILNRCVDSGIAEAIRQYWQRSSEATAQQEAEHFGGLAHELRNSLGTARLAVDAIHSGRVSSVGRTSDLLKSALARMDELLERSLAEVRDRGKPQLRRARLRLEGILRMVAESTIRRRDDVDIEVDVPSSIELEGDETLLVSAVTNLVQNAVKFTRPGTKVIVSGRERDGQAEVTVADQCGGLPVGQEQRLFEPFHQAGADRSGVGLGLPITRKAVEAHGGDLTVRNIPGHGCVFVVTLPKVSSVAPPPAFQS